MNQGLIPLGKPPTVVVNQVLAKTWDQLLEDPPVAYHNAANWRTQAPDVRPSGFPFCPRKYALGKFGVRVPSTFNVRASVYTEIGTAVHAVGQDALARTGRLWGFWKCCRPGCETMLSDQPGFWPGDDQPCAAMLLDPDGTPRPCRSTRWSYHELSLEDTEIGLKGHTDGVLFLKNRQAVLEIKTAGDEKVSRVKSLSGPEIAIMLQTEAPWYGYWHQASTYASLLRMQYPDQLDNLDTVEFMIFSRDNPANVACFSVRVPTDDSWYLEIKARVLAAKQAVQDQYIPIGFAKTPREIDELPPCKYCELKDLCLKPGLKKADALTSPRLKQAGEETLMEKRQLMGMIIRGDVVEPTEILSTKPEDEEALPESKETEATDSKD